MSANTLIAAILAQPERQATPKDYNEAANLLSTLEELDLSAIRLDDEDVKLIAANSTIKKLNLSCTGIGDKAVEYLATSKTLQHIDLYGNNITNPRPLFTSRSILTLDIADNQIADQHMIRAEMEKWQKACVEKGSPKPQCALTANERQQNPTATESFVGRGKKLLTGRGICL